MAGAQPLPVGAGEEGDRGLRESRGEVVRADGRLSVDGGFGSLGPAQHGDGRGAGVRGVEACEGFGYGQEAGRVGAAGFGGAYGVGEEGTDGCPQVAYGGEARVVGDKGDGFRHGVGVGTDPGGEPCGIRQVVRMPRRWTGPAAAGPHPSPVAGGTTATGAAACSRTAWATEPIMRAGASRRRR